MGSKSRIAKYILPIILRDRKLDQWYVEPFVGGANIIDKVSGNRIGSDIDEYLIEALKLIRDCPESLPKNNTETNEQIYKEIKKYCENKGLRGYYGYALSYGGKLFGGFCRDKIGKRDYVNESYRNAIKQSDKLKGVELICCSYDELKIPNDSIIYCDPPYAETTKYKNDIDHIKFWNWVREKNKKHKVFISEYSAPNDFICVWSKEICSSLTQNRGGKRGVEKLFVHKTSYNN